MALIPLFDKYSITRKGIITNTNTGRQLKSFQGNAGYKIVQLYSQLNQKKHTFTIARLLALTYIPNPDNKPSIDHINRDRSDDRIENLRWASNTEQCENRCRRPSKSGIRFIRQNGKKWEYQRITNGIRYRKYDESKVKICFEHFCHQRMLDYP